MCHLDTWYLVGAHKYLVYAHIAPTRYQVSSWGTYVHKLDTKYLVGAHMGPNSIPSIELMHIRAPTRYLVSSWGA